MRVAGLDLSLAGTAVVVLEDDGRVSSALAFTSTARDVSRCPAWLELRRSTSVAQGDAVADYHRTTDVADAVRVFLRARLATGSPVGVEDHAFGAKGSAIYQLGHLHGVVRRDVVSALGCRFLLLGVGEVKLAATGRGNAEKADMIEAAREALQTDGLSRGLQEALADAYAVARLTWLVRRYPQDSAPLPPAVNRLILGTKNRAGLIQRPWIG